MGRLFSVVFPREHGVHCCIGESSCRRSEHRCVCQLAYNAGDEAPQHRNLRACCPRRCLFLRNRSEAVSGRQGATKGSHRLSFGLHGLTFSSFVLKSCKGFSTRRHRYAEEGQRTELGVFNRCLGVPLCTATHSVHWASRHVWLCEKPSARVLGCTTTTFFVSHRRSQLALNTCILGTDMSVQFIQIRNCKSCVLQVSVSRTSPSIMSDP